MRWLWRRRVRVVATYACPTCGRLLTGMEQCGRLHAEGQDFPDGGWVLWRSFTPCSEAAPGGVKPLVLDDPGDLDADDATGKVSSFTVGVSSVTPISAPAGVDGPELPSESSMG